jgi:hypothetical protein
MTSVADEMGSDVAACCRLTVQAALTQAIAAAPGTRKQAAANFLLTLDCICAAPPAHTLSQITSFKLSNDDEFVAAAGIYFANTGARPTGSGVPT